MSPDLDPDVKDEDKLRIPPFIGEVRLSHPSMLELYLTANAQLQRRMYQPTRLPKEWHDDPVTGLAVPVTKDVMDRAEALTGASKMEGRFTPDGEFEFK